MFSGEFESFDFSFSFETSVPSPLPFASRKIFLISSSMKGTIARVGMLIIIGPLYPTISDKYGSEPQWSKWKCVTNTQSTILFRPTNFYWCLCFSFTLSFWTDQRKVWVSSHIWIADMEPAVQHDSFIKKLQDKARPSNFLPSSFFQLEMLRNWPYQEEKSPFSQNYKYFLNF